MYIKTAVDTSTYNPLFRHSPIRKEPRLVIILFFWCEKSIQKIKKEVINLGRFHTGTCGGSKRNDRLGEPDNLNGSDKGQWPDFQRSLPAPSGTQRKQALLSKGVLRRLLQRKERQRNRWGNLRNIPKWRSAGGTGVKAGDSKPVWVRQSKAAALLQAHKLWQKQELSEKQMLRPMAWFCSLLLHYGRIRT